MLTLKWFHKFFDFLPIHKDLQGQFSYSMNIKWFALCITWRKQSVSYSNPCNSHVATI